MEENKNICESNFLLEFDNTYKNYFYNYSNIVVKFLKYISETIIVNDTKYYIYIIFKGIEIISHVYKVLLLYSKNIDLTCYQTQKAFYYYVEFISQINNENNSYLNLNIKDVLLFVYRKTIFNINDEFKSKYNINNSQIEILNLLNNKIECFENIIYLLIENYFINNNVLNLIECYNVTLIILEYYLYLDIIIDKNYDIYLFFIELLQICINNKLDIESTNNIISLLIKKLKKYTEIEELFHKMNLNLSNENINKQIKNNSYNKFINILLH